MSRDHGDIDYLISGIEALKALVCHDNDSDRYSEGSLCQGEIVCNDSEQNINPGTDEVCNNSLDNNCDGTVDEDCIYNLDGPIWEIGSPAYASNFFGVSFTIDFPFFSFSQTIADGII